MQATTQDKIDVTESLVRPQFPASPEGQLMAAIVMQAVRDAFCEDFDFKQEHARAEHERNKISGLRYLVGDMPHATICGVDPDWIRLLLCKFKLLK
jgi:hypothetical protein